MPVPFFEPSKWPRRITVPIEIIEDGRRGFLRVIIDGHYHASIYSDYRMYKGDRLYNTLIELLEKYQPRRTIDAE